MTRVLLIAPIPALRLGLRALLADSDLEIIGEADRLDSPDLIDAEAEVVIYASASAAFPAPQAALPAAAVLLLTDDHSAVPALARTSAAWGVLLLDSSREELLAAVHALSQGLIVGAAPLLGSVLKPFSPAVADGSEAPPLSERELEVLGLLAGGLANKQIAVELGISEHTVKFHVSSIYTKLGVTNRAEAVRQGVRRGLIAV